MRIYRVLLTILVVAGILLPAAESLAVIYKYVNEKGEPVFVDDMTKVPEPQRATAVVVTGANEQEVQDDAERARALAARQAMEHNAAAAQRLARDETRSRFIRSGVAVALVVAALFVIMNIDALREQKELMRKVRLGMIGVLVVFLAVSHAGDVAGLFRKTGSIVPSPFEDLQAKQAERGKKAAEAYKAIGKMLSDADQQKQQEAERIQRQLDDAERGK